MAPDHAAGAPTPTHPGPRVAPRCVESGELGGERACTVGHPLKVLKRQFGYEKERYRDLLEAPRSQSRRSRFCNL